MNRLGRAGHSLAHKCLIFPGVRFESVCAVTRCRKPTAEQKAPGFEEAHRSFPGAAGIAFGLFASAHLAVGSTTSISRCDDDLQPQQVRRIRVAREADIMDGDMKQFRIAPTLGGTDGAVLVARVDGKLYATGASCSHYSAPLVQGVVSKDKMHVVCPWHDAAFDIRTGAPVRGCALEAIPTYPVCVEDGHVVVEVPMQMEDFVKPKAARRSLNDKRVFVVMGGGAAGVAAVDSLRQEGYTGQLIMLTDEKFLPYDRPVLSKNLSKAGDVESLYLREREHFEEHDVEVRHGATVVSVNAAEKTIKLSSGEEIKYDAALVATGATPRALPIPGGKLPGVMALRNPEDAQKIAAACPKGKRVVVIGSSFIGMEIAATLNRRGCDVTVLGMESVPFERVLGTKLGSSIKTLFESKGVIFKGGVVVGEIQQGAENSLTAVLKSGDKIACDAVIVGVGVQPNCKFVEGVEKAPDGALLTDEFLQTSAPGLFAAGDLANYKSPQTGEQLRCEHWVVASSQGRFAAKAMVGNKESFDQTPFFWTSLFGKNIRYVGNCTKFDDLIIDGDVNKLNFVAFYCQSGVVKAVATMGRDQVAAAAGELMRMGKMPAAKDFKTGKAKPADLAEELRKLRCAS